MDTQINSEAILTDVRKSRCLGKSARQFNLLKFLLEKSLAGEADTVTQYGIALDVLERSDDFDPASDSIVRVEMHRLRAALKRYNATSEKFRLNLPKGGFNIQVESVSPKNEIALPWFGRFGPVAAIGLAFVSFGVGTLTNFWADTGDKIEQVCATYIPNVEARVIGENLSSDNYMKPLLKSMLSQYSNISVVENVAKCRSNGLPGYVTTLTSLEIQDTISVLFEVRDNESGKAIMSRVFNSEDTIIAVNEVNSAFNFWLASAVSDLSNPYGIIVRESLKKPWDNESAKQGYECMLSMYDGLYTTETEDDYESTLSCLEEAVGKENASLDVKGSLALTYLDQARSYREPTIENPFDAVATLITESGENWIDSYEMVNARITYEADRPDYNEERFRSILSQVDAKFTWNGHIKGVLAIYYGFKLGEWSKAELLNEQAHAIHSIRDSSMMAISTASAMIQPEGPEDISVCSNVYAENSIVSNLLILGCAGQLGDRYWVDKSNANLSRLGFENADAKIKFLRDKNFDEKLTDVILRAIQKDTTN